MHAHVLDSLREPGRDLLSTDEANISSHLRSSLDILRKFHRDLDRCQVDIAQTGIVIHKRGHTRNRDRDIHHLHLEVLRIDGFRGRPDSLVNQRTRGRLLRSLEKMDELRKDESCGFKNCAITVFSDARAIFLKVNDGAFQRCVVKNISPERKKRYIDIIDRVIYITRENDFTDRAVFQAKVMAYEKDIDQLVPECLEQDQNQVSLRILGNPNAKEARIEGHL